MDGLVLTAAGASTRFGADESKVLHRLAGETVLCRALAPFRDALDRLAIVITARAEDVERIARDVPDARVVAGGTTRQESVRAGVHAVPEDVDVILVHDAARPLVTAVLIKTVCETARLHGAAAPVLTVTDTLHALEGALEHPAANLLPGIDRGGLVAAQTPQAARAALLRDALERAHADGFAGTDEVSLLLRAGVPVAPVEGDPVNFKLTTPRDLEIAERLFAPRE